MGSELRRRIFVRGEIHPRSSPHGSAQRHAECLIEGADPQIEVVARFARPIERRVFDPAGNPVEDLIAAGRPYDGGEELEEHEVTLSDLPNRTAEIAAAGSRRAELREAGAPAGAIAWRWEPLHATVEAWLDEIAPGLRRVRVEIANRLEWAAESPEGAHLRTIRGAHLLLHSPDGAFVSLAHPPAHLREASATCRNEGLWPTPIGEAGDRRTVLAAPLRLEDYPRADHVGPQIDVAA